MFRSATVAQRFLAVLLGFLRFFCCHPDRRGRFFLPRRLRRAGSRSAVFASRVPHRYGGTPATNQPNSSPLSRLRFFAISLLSVLCALCVLCVKFFSSPLFTNHSSPSKLKSSTSVLFPAIRVSGVHDVHIHLSHSRPQRSRPPRLPPPPPPRQKNCIPISLPHPRV